MKTKAQTLNRSTRNTFQTETGNAVVDYYTDAGPDYEFWSKNFNMHFGFSVKRWDCLSREVMLQRMNQLVLDSLNIQSGAEVVDMGCGLGATVRYGAQNFPGANFTGFTITPWQVKQSGELIDQLGLSNAEVKFGDYNQLPIESETIDAAYGLESICHAEGTDKAGPLSEAYRVLKTGGSFTMVDGFIKKPEAQLSQTVKNIYDVVFENWALPSFPNINEVVYKMKCLGFHEIEVKEISWQIAPSAVHAPILTLLFLIKSLLKGEKLKKQSWKNLKACFMIFFLGLFRSSIGYYKITARK